MNPWRSAEVRVETLILAVSGGKLMVNPWCSAEVRVETLILGVSGGEVEGESLVQC